MNFLHPDQPVHMYVTLKSVRERDHEISSASSPLESIWTTPCRPAPESEMEQILTRMEIKKIKNESHIITTSCFW